MCELGREGRWEVVREEGWELVSGESSGLAGGLDVGTGEMLPSVEVTRPLLWWLSSTD